MILHRVLPAFRNDSAGGVLLILSALFALILANSSAAPFYFDLLNLKIAGMSILHWINDGLMAIFFLFVGLEIKRELLIGELDTWPKRALPGVAALGGMLLPMALFAAFNAHDPALLPGLPIPAATDIAFALGILAFLGNRVPSSLKIFLTALAILDDMGAIAIIAIFYTDNVNILAMGMAAGMLALMIISNRLRIKALWLYGALALALWVFTLDSGIHATLAGVAAACFVPLGKDHHPPLEKLEHLLRPWVNFAILPLFGLANAGVALSGFGTSLFQNSLVLGIASGLFFGKQIGVFGSAWIAIQSGFAIRPRMASWLQIYGVATLCGIGFTMSLFIGVLAFDQPHLQDAVKVSVLAASALSTLLGITLLLWANRK